MRQGGKSSNARGGGALLALCLLIGFFAIMSGFAVAGFVSFRVVGFYALMSVVSFIMYGLDKAAARRGTWRTAEATLHLAGLAGGWPGALVAQRVFCHKTKKASFQFVFWLAVAVNCAALAWLLESASAAGLRTSLGIE